MARAVSFVEPDASLCGAVCRARVERDSTDGAGPVARTGRRTHDAERRGIRRPRIGVYEPWGGNMSAGWTRWILEQYGFDYVTLRPADFHAPLADKWMS